MCAHRCLARRSCSPSPRVPSPSFNPPPAALSFQTLFAGLLILAPAGPVSETFAGLRPFPPEFRGKLCLLLATNLATSWVSDEFASWAYTKLKGRSLCGRVIA